MTAERDEVYRLMDSVELDPAQELDLDVCGGTLRFRGATIPVTLPAGARDQLLCGTWDAAGTLLSARDALTETANRLPYITGF